MKNSTREKVEVEVDGSNDTLDIILYPLLFVLLNYYGKWQRMR